MSGVPFFQTGMGRRFFESTLPRLVDELAALTAVLRELVPLARELVATRHAAADEPPEQSR